MSLKELISRTSLKAIGLEIGLDVRIENNQLVCTPLDPDDPRYSVDFILPSMKMIEVCRANDFDFFQPFISTGKLTTEQMHHAAERYYLGKTKSGLPIFWMIDDMQNPLDAHIGNGTWISHLLKKRKPLLQCWSVNHCLFGLHLLTSDIHSHTSSISPHTSSICIVEREEAAVVLSELFPESIWMAYATVSHLEVDLFDPLQNCTVILFPCTDPCMSNYLFFDDLATKVRKRYPSIDITVSSILEDNATEDQKSRNIDLLEYLQESIMNSS